MILLKITAYQVLLLLIGVPFLIVLIASMLGFFISFPVVFASIPFLMFFCAFIWFSWYWVAGNFLYYKLNLAKNRELLLFKILFLCLVVYTIVSVVIIVIDVNAFFHWLFFILKCLGTIGYFYCTYFIARQLNKVEAERPIKFGDWIYDMLALLVFPAGIFVIQPRINNLIADNS